MPIYHDDGMPSQIAICDQCDTEHVVFEQESKGFTVRVERMRNGTDRVLCFEKPQTKYREAAQLLGIDETLLKPCGGY